ncbi:MAG: endopeptidase La, partial [Candidatus Hydrogenedens sp.]
MGKKNKVTKNSAENLLPHQELPVLPLTDIVLFPKNTVPILVSKDTSIHAIQESMQTSEKIFLAYQTYSKFETKEPSYLEIGTIAQIQQALILPDNTIKIVIDTQSRAKIINWIQEKPFMKAEVQPFSLESIHPSNKRNKKSFNTFKSVLIKEFEIYATENTKIPSETLKLIQQCSNFEEIIDIICTYLNIPVYDKQDLIKLTLLKDIFSTLIYILRRENSNYTKEKKVISHIKYCFGDDTKSWILDDSEDSPLDVQSISDYSSDIDELKQLIKKSHLPPHVLEKANAEIKHMEKVQSYSPEYSTIMEYIEWLCNLPWNKRTKDRMDLNRAKKILDRDHYGLDKVKERILDFLAIRILSNNLTKGPVLCLVGPPGVGKTSLGKSIALALNRKFIRMSLGGIRDEAEIRGHIRTYVASMPGKIIQNIKTVKVKNPVFVLDEVDKIGTDFRGDPASALLEVLDPEQNKYFTDHYLNVEFDLSEVFFIATANNEYNIPHPLFDRMEVIRIPGYTPTEKYEIARKHLIPRQIKLSGLKKNNISFKSESIKYLITKYTEEAGVRELERQISGVVRKVARWIVTKEKKYPIIITKNEVENILGSPIYSHIQMTKNLSPGMAVGMAWTPYGGTIQIIETSIMEGKGKLLCTGQLGSVMTESAQTALTFIRSNSSMLNISANFYKDMDIHIHAPEASIPKDGPSAGITIAVSLLSALLKRPIPEGIAMTGEITLT